MFGFLFGNFDFGDLVLERQFENVSLGTLAWGFNFETSVLEF